MKLLATPERRVRVVSALACAGLLLVLHALGTSRSENGVVLGAWSNAIAAAIVFALAFLIFFVLSASGWKLTSGKLAKTAGRLPELIGPVLLFVVPSIVFLSWFLSLSLLFLRFSFTAGAFLLALVPGSLLVLSRDNSQLRHVVSGTAVMAVSLLIALTAGELVLRRILPDQIFNPRFGLRPYCRYDLQIDLPGIDPGGVLSTNRWGLRGEDPPSDWNEYLTVVTVGGSTTADYYLDDSKTWSNVVQNELRSVNPMVWVGNAGIPRHSADTHALFVKEVLSQIKPDVALFLVGVNDMGPFLRGGDGGEGRLEDSGPRSWLFSRSMILQLIYKIKKVNIDGVQVINTVSDPPFLPEPLTTAEMPLPDDLHDLLADPDFYRNRIIRLIAQCREQGITPVFLTQPLLYEDNSHWRTLRESAVFFQGTERPISAATFALMLETLNSDLLEVCREQGVAVYDLASNVPHSEMFFYDSMHMTEAGSALTGSLVGRFMADYLVEAGLLIPAE
ncbi:MAG: SGNH/GDSL hydrolase family protein [Candidatus Fermentibacteraceae bacterium]